MSPLLTFWSHALPAVLFATVLLWQLRSGVRAAGQGLLLAGLLLTAIWAWVTAVDPSSMLASHAETARNLVWVGLLHALAVTGREQGTRQQGVSLVYAAVAGVLGLQFIADLLPLLLGETPPVLAGTAIVLRITAAAGALVLVHNLYGQAAPASRTSIRLAMLALAWTWTYDLNLYTVAYLDTALARSLFEWRGAVIALSAPLFALGGQGAGGWRIKLSRAATFQSLSLLAICSYFAVMAILATALRGTESNWAQGLTIAVLAAMTIAAMVLLPSTRARSWAKVKLAKHLFEHRYDYRTEWLRFAATLGRSGSEAPLSERVIKAFADIVDAPAGLLIAPDDSDRPDHAAAWNWHGRPPSLSDLEPLWEALERDGRILEFDAHRHRWGNERDLDMPVPAPWLAEDRLWAGIPLIHNDRLAGLVLLAAPELRRTLDWEDFDLLRTAGRQAASILAEAHGQQALMNAQRFEEFNRRFAFILHDVKNLVSQLSLLARNSERHADNPEFRTDMIATLKSSVGKMNDLLARLAPQGAPPPSHTAGVFPLRTVLSNAIATGRRNHDVRLIGDASAQAMGDPVALEQAVGHLLQNAVEASPLTEPVIVRVVPSDRQVTIEIIDKGAGMDAEFVRSRLFQPFASTKAEGFGIGAFEARSLIQAMGGRLTVESRAGEGSRFIIQLAAATTAPMRKSA